MQWQLRTHRILNVDELEARLQIMRCLKQFWSNTHRGRPSLIKTELYLVVSRMKNVSNTGTGVLNDLVGIPDENVVPKPSI